MNKRILHLIDSGGFYGAEAVVLNLSLGLKERRWTSVVGCFWVQGARKPALGEIAESLGLDVRYISLKNRLDLFALRQIRKIVKSEHIALIHSHGYKPSFFCLLLHFLFRIPYVITCHLWLKETLRGRLYVVLDRMSMMFAEKVFAVSNPIARDISLWGKVRAKVQVVNNGINVERYWREDREFDPSALREKLGLQAKSRLVGTLGRLTPQKAHQYLIEAATILLKENQNIEFLVGGDGPRLGALENLSAQQGIAGEFHFLGYRPDAINVLRLLDIFVLSSIDEGLPIVLLEAMSLGLPVVVTDVGEIPGVIQNGENGILVRKGDVPALAGGIRRILEDPEFGRRLGQKAKGTVKLNYSTAVMAEKYIEAYEAVGCRGGARS